MRRPVPAVRILPMSDQAEGFRGRSIEQVQREVFLGDLPAKRGRWRYRKAGLSADPGTVVLFQFKARVIASAVFLRDEPLERPDRSGSSGALYFEPGSFRTFEPVDAAGMRKAWPRFRAFGHVKQFLNPEGYGVFVKGLRGVKSPGREKPKSACTQKPKSSKNPKSQRNSKAQKGKSSKGGVSAPAAARQGRRQPRAL